MDSDDLPASDELRHAKRTLVNRVFDLKKADVIVCAILMLKIVFI